MQSTINFLVKCFQVNDRCLGFPEKLQSLPLKFTRSDFHTFIFPVLAAMVTYHDYLDRNRQVGITGFIQNYHKYF